MTFDFMIIVTLIRVFFRAAQQFYNASAMKPHLSLDREAKIPVIKGLVLDLNADRGIEAEDGSRVYTWRNQVEAVVADIFLKQDEGRRVLVCSLKGDMKIWADHYRV